MLPDVAIWGTVGSGLTPGSPLDGQFLEKLDPDSENPENLFLPICAHSKGQIWVKRRLNLQNEVSRDQK